MFTVERLGPGPRRSLSAEKGRADTLQGEDVQRATFRDGSEFIHLSAGLGPAPCDT